MNKQEQDEAKKLLKATFEILQKCAESPFVPDVLSTTSIWDGVTCDGYCLMDEIESLLIDLDITATENNEH